jgi:hypothetical protein
MWMLPHWHHRYMWQKPNQHSSFDIPEGKEFPARERQKEPASSTPMEFGMETSFSLRFATQGEIGSLLGSAQLWEWGR